MTSTATSTTAPSPAGVFDSPPADPLGLFRDWLADARAKGVDDPGALALATTDADGHAANRIVQIVGTPDEGLLFTTHSGSRKGRELASVPWASGVLYWRETKQQIILAGPVTPVAEAESERLWDSRAKETHPMSAVSQQSMPLDDEDRLRAAAERVAAAGGPVPRPAAYTGYLLAPRVVEFWQGSKDRLHRRLRYERAQGAGPDAGAGWSSRRLQP
ncbi:phenazine biosynthesis FMN-dependent oxidase PhzG [Streptomyces sp. NPDC048182]|uniref:phenazine biosynthesis FMN-dependent oxidase PhzG n=1 Tax=Streptomyces sp. NPDC048182 TaxID=3365507 RepID=UPI0037191852